MTPETKFEGHENHLKHTLVVQYLQQGRTPFERVMVKDGSNPDLDNLIAEKIAEALESIHSTPPPIGKKKPHYRDLRPRREVNEINFPRIWQRTQAQYELDVLCGRIVAPIEVTLDKEGVPIGLSVGKFANEEDRIKWEQILKT